MSAERRPLLRARHPNQHARVTFVELFFDLVFVFAVTQISHRLLEHFTPGGALEAAMLLLAVWWAWIYTAWATNWLDPDRHPVRLMLFTGMLASLILSAAIPEAFEGRGLAFGLGFAVLQVGRTAFLLAAIGPSHPVLKRNFQRILVWLAVAGALWVAGGFAHGSTRFALWTSALILDYIGPLAAFWLPGLGRSRTTDWDVEGAHMAERCGLFMIIALGESVLVTGSTLSGLPWTPARLTAFAVAFAGSAAMWWIYFDACAGAASQNIATSKDPGRLARLGYTYLHIPMVAGIILTAVGDEMVLAHPDGAASMQMAIAVLGGSALYLAGAASFKWGMMGVFPWPLLLAAAALALMIPLAPFVSPLGLAVTALIVLLAIAAVETTLVERFRERMRTNGDH
jgi:low temperature requirement protein LtrA